MARWLWASALLGGALVFATPGRAQTDDASGARDENLASYRERFKQGFDRYQEGDVAGALSYWEPLYRDLGPARGYRVGYNLARAYEVVGDATRAAERYESFLAEVTARQSKGESQDPVVAHDAAQAQGRLDELTKTRARIRVAGSAQPVSVRIDQTEPRISGFVAYVAPGGHDVVFAPGTAQEHREHVEARAGEVVDVAPPARPTEDRRQELPPPPKPPRTEDRVVHPFSSTWLWVAGAATLLGAGFTLGAYANAVSLSNAYQPPPPPTAAEVNSYYTARTVAYASWAAPSVFAVATAVLTAWYFLGKKHVQVTVSAASAGLSF